MKVSLWIVMAYALARTLMADLLMPLIAYGSLFCLSAALIVFFDEALSD